MKIAVSALIIAVVLSLAIVVTCGILPKRGNDSTDSGSSSTTLLHSSAPTGSPQEVEEFIEELKREGGDINAKDEDGATLLHLVAAQNEDPAVAVLLIEQGADVTVSAQNGATPLHLAAAQNVNPAMVEVLLDGGADVNADDWLNATPLHLAAAQNPNATVVRALLEWGADVNERNSMNATPLHSAAAENPNPAVMEALLDGGADIDAARFGGETPLHEAAKSNDREVVMVLLDRGANTEAEFQRRTPCIGRYSITTWRWPSCSLTGARTPTLGLNMETRPCIGL